MKAFTALALFSAAASVSALQLTEPADGAEWDLSKTNIIKWKSVETDPEEFKLVLIDASGFPEKEYEINSEVETEEGEYKLTNFVAQPGKKFKVKAFSTANTNSGQLAESQTFEVTKSGVEATTTPKASLPPTGSPTNSADNVASTSTSSGLGVTGQAVGVAGPIAALLAMLV